MIRMGAFIARELFAARGIIAGCSLATTFTKIYTVTGYDIFVYRCPGVVLDNYIDDNVASTEGTEDEVVARLANASEVLAHIVRDEFCCQFAPSKTRVVASSNGLGRRVRDAVRGQVGGQLVVSAPNLGADCAAAKPRRAHGRHNQRAARLKEGLRRRRRIAKVRAVLGDKAIPIFSTGTLSKMVYASEVHGLSDGELLAVRRTAAAAMRPRARGRSLQMLLALHRDPCWRAAVGPLLQYTRAVWRAARRGYGRAELSITEIRSAWENIDTDCLLTRRGGGQDGRTTRMWSRVRGPLSATFLTMQRIGWRFDGPFTIIDDLGTSRQILQHSPALWAEWARAAVVRDLERSIASRWSREQPQYAGRRICLDHLRPQLACHRTGRKRRGEDAMTTGIMRAVVCNALWTNDRAHQADSRVSPCCRLCGAPRDTLHHRLWYCPCTAEERDAIAGQQLIRRARAAGEADRFYTTGVFPHPGDTWPSAAEEPDIRVTRHDGGPTEGRLLFHGHFYPDGSCSTHVIPELRRASLAVFIKNDKGEDVVTVDTPLWKELPQTPQAAEYAAYAVATQYLGGPSTMHGDCENVVRDASAGPKAQLSARKRYAGIMRYTHSDPAQLRCWREVRKVKAHVNLAAIIDPEEWRHADGNAKADAAAKEALSRHPVPPPADVTMLNVTLEDAAKIMRLAAAALRKWPAESRRFAPRRSGGDAANRARRSVVQHEWVKMDRAWRCRTCLRCHLGVRLGGTVRHERCPGPRLNLQQRRLQEKGHSLCIAQGEGMPVKFCSRCGAWSTRRAFNLSKQCPKVPSAAGRQALARIARGRHPWLAVGRREEDRMTVQMTTTHEPRSRGAGETDDASNIVATLGPPPVQASSGHSFNENGSDGRRDDMDIDGTDGGMGHDQADQASGAHAEDGGSGHRVGDDAATHGGADTVQTHPRGSAVGTHRRRGGDAPAAPSREQIQAKLVQSAVAEAAARAAKRRAAGLMPPQGKTPAQRIREVRERFLARQAAAREAPQGLDLRPEDRGSHWREHPGERAFPQRLGVPRAPRLDHEGHLQGDPRVAPGPPGLLGVRGADDATAPEAEGLTAAGVSDGAAEAEGVVNLLAGHRVRGDHGRPRDPGPGRRGDGAPFGKYQRVGADGSRAQLLRTLGGADRAGASVDGAEVSAQASVAQAGPAVAATPSVNVVHPRLPGQHEDGAPATALTRTQLIARLREGASCVPAGPVTSSAPDGRPVARDAAARGPALPRAPRTPTQPRTAAGSSTRRGSPSPRARDLAAGCMVPPVPLAAARSVIGRSRSPGAAAAPPRYPSTDPRASRPG